VNYSGTERVARACLETGSRLVFLSTTSVYGSQSELVDEDCPEEELKPQSPYAESKLHAERLLRDLGPAGLKFITFRFGTIFGTSIGMRFHTAINKFCWQACAGLPITVWRTALHQKRPYLALSDAIRAIDFVIQNNHFDGQTYNVLTANATVGEIVDTIKAIVPDALIEYTDSRSMNQLSYEVARAKFAALGFSFNGGLRAGIAETIDLIRGMRQRLNGG
jgi:nucleoside-diphosphate-sugar epimerase